jgi:hypothetical protein
VFEHWLMISHFQKHVISFGQTQSDMINKTTKKMQDRSILHANLWYYQAR